jgi:hypothetical protein
MHIQKKTVQYQLEQVPEGRLAGLLWVLKYLFWNPQSMSTWAGVLLGGEVFLLKQGQTQLFIQIPWLLLLVGTAFAAGYLRHSKKSDH